MKIQHLSVKNFLAIESVKWDLSGAPIHLCAGPNEAGKSSLRDSISWALTGQARGLKTHEQQAAFIHEGAKTAEVTITWADKTTTTRKKTPKTPASVTGPIPEDAVMLSILADPLHFLSLEDKARREVLFRLLPGLSPTRSDLAIRLSSALGEVKFEEHTVGPINDLAKVAIEKGFAAAETEAINRRIVAKRIVKEFAAEEPEPKATIGGVLRILPDIQTADVEAGLSALRAERDKLQRNRGKVEAKVDKLPELEAALVSLEASPPDPPDPDRPVEDFVKALEINRGILEALQRDVGAMTEGQDPQNFPALCPAFNIGCPSAGKEAVKGTIPTGIVPAVIARAKADLQEQEKEVTLIETDLAAARLAQVTYDDYCKQRQVLADKIAKIKEAQVQAQDTATIDDQITALDLRMKTGYELLDAVREFWRKKDAADAAQAKIAQAEKEIALYDALAKALAPDGIPSQLIAEALGPVNERLAFASGYLFPDIDEHEPLRLTQDLEVCRGTTPYALLSKSARYRAGIAFQFVLATLAGSRLLMIDEADILDPLNRANLIDFLLAIRQDFDTILCFATSDHADPSPIPELAVWWISDGQVAPVRAQEAA